MRLTVAALVAAGLLLATSSPAAASCAPPAPLSENAARAEAVVYGTVTGSGSGAITLRVDRALKGKAAGTLKVFVGPGRGGEGGGVFTSIDYSADIGTDHVLYLIRGADGQLETNACIGSHSGAPTPLESAFFGGASPQPSAPASAPASPPASPPAPAPPESDRAPAFAGIAALVVVAVALAAFALRRRLIAFLLVALVTSSCAGMAPVAAAAEIRSAAARAAADPAALDATRAALDAFAVDLYRALAKQDGNVVLSPYSVAAALAMARAGAVGQTRSEMEKVLHAPSDLDAGINALEQALAKRPGKYPSGEPAKTLDLELATANRLWGQRGFAFEKPFLDRLAAYYGAGMQVVDYRAAPEEARNEINEYVADRTRDRIKDLVPRGAIDELTRLVLTNAIYLKASWTVEFDKAQAGAFHRLDGSEVQAQLMRRPASPLYGRADGVQAVRLPYVGGLSMTVIVPDAGTFASFEKGLDGARLRALLANVSDTTAVRLWLPKFEFRSRSPLNSALKDLGMPTAFTDRADFSAITKEDKLAIAAALHQAFISVDEKGTEAAAATAVVMGVTSAPARNVELRVDRPFLFAITDDETGAVLFLGRVLDPTR